MISIRQTMRRNAICHCKRYCEGKSFNY